MNILRRFGLSLAVILFSLSTSALLIIVSFYFVFNTPLPLEKALSASGIYNGLVQTIITQQTSVSSSPLVGDSATQQALEQALPPVFLQNSAESILSNMYAWVQGGTTTPNLSIDLSKVKNDFANNIATYTQQKLNALPICAQGAIPPATLDEVLSLSCLPSGVSSASIADAARQQTMNSGLFPTGNTIDINSAVKNPQGQTLTDQLSAIPVAHTYYNYSLYAVPVFVFLFALAIIYLSATKRSGFKRIAWLLITTGLTTVAATVLGVWLLNEAVAKLGAATTTLQDKLLLVLQAILTDLRIWWIWFGAGYITIGIVLLIIVRLTRPKTISPEIPTIDPHQSNGQLPPVANIPYVPSKQDDLPTPPKPLL